VAIFKQSSCRGRLNKKSWRPLL